MKNGKLSLSGFMCGADSVNCIPHAPKAASGGRGATPMQRRQGGPLDVLGPRRPSRPPHGFKEGLDDWKARATDPEQKRAEAAELMEKAQAAGARELALSKLGLTRLTSQIGAMKPLQRLDLSHNKLKKLPASIGDLENLTHLIVDFNELESLPKELENLSQLEELSAKTNRLFQMPEAIYQLTHLKTVDLKSNQIWTLPPKWAELIGRLRILDLSDNNLKQLPALPDSTATGARADVRGRTLDLDLSNNDIAKLPTGFGAFRYKGPLSNHVLINAAGTIVVRTENTRIREALVSTGRLAAGRGVSSDAAQAFARQERMSLRKKVPLEQDNASVDSYGDYVLRNGEPGQSYPFQQPPPQAVPEPEPAKLGEQPEWTKPGAMQGSNDLAGLFAALGTQPPFAADRQSMPYAGAAIPGSGHAAPAAPNARTDLVSVLAAELQSLPENERAAILGVLASVPPASLEAELARMQSGWQGVAGVPPATHQFAMPPAPPFGASLGAPAQQGMPSQFVAQPIASGVQPQPFAGTSAAWTSADQLGANEAPAPWAGASGRRFGKPDGDGERWAPPRWVASAAKEDGNEPEPIHTYGEPLAETSYGWTSPPTYGVSLQPAHYVEPEEPDLLSMFENLMRRIEGP